MPDTAQLTLVIALTTALSSLLGAFVQWKLSTHKARTENAQAEAASSATALSGYRDLCDNLEARIDVLTKRLEAAEERVNRQQAEIEKLREENGQLRRRIAELEQERK